MWTLINTTASGDVYLDPVTSEIVTVPVGTRPSGSSEGGIYTSNIPTISATPLPFPKSTPTTTLDKILASSLSALALLKNAGSIPTAQQQQYGYGYSAETLAALQARNLYPSSDGTASGKVELWLKNNTGVALIVGGFVLFYLLPSPRRSSR